jgi:hypothetical protein
LACVVLRRARARFSVPKVSMRPTTVTEHAELLVRKQTFRRMSAVQPAAKLPVHAFGHCINLIEILRESQFSPDLRRVIGNVLRKVLRILGRDSNIAVR